VRVRIYGNILANKLVATYSNICLELLKIGKALKLQCVTTKRVLSNTATRIKFLFTYSNCPIQVDGWFTDRQYFLAGTSKLV
jgi:hypothetical protein